MFETKKVRKGELMGRLLITRIVDSESINVVNEEIENGNENTKMKGKSETNFNELLKDLGIDKIVGIQTKTKKKLKKLLARRIKAFGNKNIQYDQVKNTNRNVKMKIKTKGNPIRLKSHRTPLSYQQVIKQHIDEMLRCGIIRPGNGRWAAPVVMARKKDGTLRFCVDYRKLNEITVKDVYPLPRIDDVLDALQGAKYFSGFDMLSGYWQIEIEEEDKAKTGFITIFGLFEFNVMPFGLTNAPATFQRAMDELLKQWKWSFCLVYVDDVIVFSKTEEEHLEHIEKFLKVVQESQYLIKPIKCKLFAQKLEFLGHIVSANGVQPDPSKVEKMLQLRELKNVKEVQTFLGGAGYYRKFIPKFAEIAQPLSDLTRKDTPFIWTNECQKAMESLKETLCRNPVLKFPDMEKMFYVQTDFSKEGISGVLFQMYEDGEHPVAYWSQRNRGGRRNYNSNTGEVWAVVRALRGMVYILW